MNTNIKISLTDEQRKILKRRITGKSTKAMISRAELNEMVNDFIAGMIKTGQDRFFEEWGKEFDTGKAEEAMAEINGHEDCCRAVELLTSRCSRLQAKLDKVGGTK